MDLSRRASMAAMMLAVAPSLTAAETGREWSGVEAAANRMVADRLVPGLQIAVHKRGRGVFSRGFGRANLETATPMTPASVCRIGSVSKQFTAAGVLLLVQDGKLSLDDPLSRVLPDFPNAQRLTIRRLLSHTSGLGNYTETTPPELVWQVSRTDRTSAQMLDLMRETGAKLRFEPGTDYRYSNTGYVLLGLVIEKLSGLSYRDFMRTRLFAPLGLSLTAVDAAAEVVPNRVSGYANDAQAPSGFDNASFTSMTYPGGAGALRSTCEDLCRWHAALLGGRVMRPPLLAAMLTPATLNDGSLPMQADGKGGRKPVRYGFGIGVGLADGRPAVSHGGSIQGFQAFVETLVNEQATLALVINTDGGSKPQATVSAFTDLQKTVRAAALA